jgi:phosphoribosylformylglycinamidine cyclo-ligase
VEKRKVITGRHIRPGDLLIGLASGGLQTNGFSLARKVFFDQSGLTAKDLLPGTHQTVADALLAVHRSFLKPVMAVLAAVPVQGMAHITGGGFVDNIPRVLPENCRAVIERASWQPPTLFKFIERQGHVDRDEMYRVFNMGIGYVLIVRAKDAVRALAMLKKQRAEPVVIGRIEKGPRGVSYHDAPA